MKYILATTTIGIAAAVGSLFVVDNKVDEQSLVNLTIENKITYYAQIDENGIVKTVIVADQAFIDSGAVGDPSIWIPTDYSVPDKAAEIGGKYDKKSDSFITKEDVRKYGNSIEKTKIPHEVIELTIATST